MELNKEFIMKCKQIITEKDEMKDYYKSAPICILDAVFSIGVKYESVINTWTRYMDYYKLVISKDKPDRNEHTIIDFINNVDSFSEIKLFAENVLNNKQRTSSSENSILKAEASYEVAKILYNHGINKFYDFRNKINKNIEDEILKVKGQGSGIMLRYLYMLLGDENKCKPDRWIYRFIHEYYPHINENSYDEIQNIISMTVDLLKLEIPDMNARWLDNSIWQYMSKK